jgi:hypothetical protein
MEESTEREREIAQQVATRTRNCEETAKYYEQRASEERASIAGIEDRVRAMYANFDALTATGLAPTIGTYTDSVYVSVKESDLVTVARILGPLDVSGKDINDADPARPHAKPTVRVTLRPKDETKKVIVTYDTRLRSDAKCKVVTERVKTRRLVCEL